MILDNGIDVKKGKKMELFIENGKLGKTHALFGFLKKETGPGC